MSKTANNVRDTLLIVFVLPLFLYGCAMVGVRISQMETYEERQQVGIEECRNRNGEPIVAIGRGGTEYYKECILPSE